jgi:hypothetical protein
MQHSSTLINTYTLSAVPFVTNSTASLLAAIQLFLLIINASTTKAHHYMDVAK